MKIKTVRLKRIPELNNLLQLSLKSDKGLFKPAHGIEQFEIVPKRRIGKTFTIEMVLCWCLVVDKSRFDFGLGIVFKNVNRRTEFFENCKLGLVHLNRDCWYNIDTNRDSNSFKRFRFVHKTNPELDVTIDTFVI